MVEYSGMVIPCLDSIDQANITTKDVFDELVRVTHEVSPICAPPLLLVAIISALTLYEVGEVLSGEVG